MKFQKLRILLPLLALAAGWGQFALGRQLYASALDEKGLLIAGHPLLFGIWGLLAAAAGGICLAVWKMDGPREYEQNFHPSVLACLGNLLLAWAVFSLVREERMFGLRGVEKAWVISGYLASQALIIAGFSRLLGKKAFFLCHGTVSVFLLLHLVTRYQMWSGNPQMQDYVMELLALVVLILYCYQTAAFAADMGKRRTQLALGLLAVVLCGGALAGTETPLLLFAGGSFALTNLCALDPRPRREGSYETA